MRRVLARVGALHQVAPLLGLVRVALEALAAPRTRVHEAEQKGALDIGTAARADAARSGTRCATLLGLALALTTGGWAEGRSNEASDMLGMGRE